MFLLQPDEVGRPQRFKKHRIVADDEQSAGIGGKGAFEYLE